MNHYVYLYRDLKRKPRYVGYGKASVRATSHLSQSHNEALNAFLSSENYTLEIAGPFENEATARCVETALISALQPDANIAPGQARYRFRPLGVPEEFSKRLTLTPLTKTDFLKRQPGHKHSLMFVRIGDKNFGDGRAVYNSANPPSDPQILQRMDRWWQLGRHVVTWKSKPESSPSVLIAVNGKPGAQVIIGAVFIDRSGWESAERDGSFYSVPTLQTAGLDALGLRGCRISRDAGFKFGAFYSQIFLILKADGTTVGGNP